MLEWELMVIYMNLLNLLNKYLKKGLNKKVKLIYSDTTTIYNKLNSENLSKTSFWRDSAEIIVISRTSL